jgi:carbamoyltransferase
MSYFDYDAFGMLQPFKAKFFEVFGPARKPGDALSERHMAVARGLQTVTEEIVVHIARGLARSQPSRDLVLTGGVALNCIANARILRDTDFQRIWVPPVASDSGAPLGAALWHHHQTLGHARRFELTHAYYGLATADADIETALGRAGLEFERLDDRALIERTARDLAAGKVVGWYQGRFEMGPRALGNRSILADPRSVEMRDGYAGRAMP